MEFIPLETQRKKVKKGGKKGSPGKGQKDAETLHFKTNTEIIKPGKGKLQSKMMEKKKVKNKYREVVAKKGSRRVALKKKDDDDDDDDDDNDDNDEDEDKEEEESSKGSQGTSEMDEEGSDSNEDEESVIQKKQENAIKEKRKKMDETLKKRLFLKMKKKILNEAQVKELHPDIKGVIFPRKKNPRWCWAVFVSQERALAAFKKLCKNSEVFVSKPNPRNLVEKKREEKLKTIKRKKENRKKLQQMWS